MSQDKPAPSRVIVELKDGRKFATGWSSRANDPDALTLGHFFSGKLTARIVGSEKYITKPQIARVIEEIDPSTTGDEHPRIVLQRRSPNETPQGRKLLGGAAKVADRLEGLTLARVDDIVDNPSDTWDGWNGATVYSDGEFQVVVGERWTDSDCVMFVSRDGKELQGGSGSKAPPRPDRRRVSGTKADSRLPVPTSVSDFLDRLKEYGFEVDDSRRHYGITHPDKPGAFSPIPRTPSDHRWADNQVSQIKQVFDIDVRQPLDGN